MLADYTRCATACDVQVGWYDTLHKAVFVQVWGDMFQPFH